MKRPEITPANVTRMAYAAGLAVATAAELDAIRTKRLDDTLTHITRRLVPTGSLRWFLVLGFWAWSGWHLLVEKRGWFR